ncbi:TPA: hypothetical protein N0F65_000867 [Lagenidium giganteum]|uniref:Putative restriction endonuclease domain-containing protein n=1 Tax=Lagenidium giganteum TaxID=4803 RepID=A0AAV2Z4Q1_9STRA|nr:TPA: hypothetical protein N0F65_000867 [Lagenidium giganteum]
MPLANGKKKDDHDVLARLVHDLKSKETLCRVKDYPRVTLQLLNEYLTEQGPLVNPAFGEQPAFFIDEGNFIPYRMVVCGNKKVAAKIAQRLGNWAETSEEGGAFVLEQRPRRPKVRMPDVAYTPRDEDRNLDCQQVWTYRGDPFVPTFVVEMKKLFGRGSQRKKLNRKMRNEYFPHGVQLGWLIDPRPECPQMFEYFIKEHVEVQCSDDTTWRDLDGRDVLPGFRIRSRVLEMVLNQECGSSEDEESNITCQVPKWHKRLQSIRENDAHALAHLEDSCIAHFEAKLARRWSK